MRKLLAIIVCKLARFVGKLIGKGSSMPGKFALKICPDILRRVQLPAHIIAVTGSNGKTSTVEMIAAILYQLTKGLTPAEIKAGGFDKYFVDHTLGIYPTSAAGMPYTAASMQSKGDAVADLMEDLAADAAIIKEQPLREKSRKPLKYKDFSHLGKTPGNRTPAFP